MTKRLPSFPAISVVTTTLLLSFTQLTQAATVSFFPTGDPTGLLNKTAGDTLNLGTTSPTLIALRVINSSLSLLAALCVGLMVYAGFLWVWARGNQDEVTKAKDIILGTVIGLVIVLSALGATQFLFQTFGDITGATVTS